MGEKLSMELAGYHRGMEKWRVRYGRKEWIFYSAAAADAFIDRMGFRGDDDDEE